MPPDHPAPRGRVILDLGQDLAACIDVAWLMVLEQLVMDVDRREPPCTLVEIRDGWVIPVCSQ